MPDNPLPPWQEDVTHDANALLAAALARDEAELAIRAAEMAYPQVTAVMLARTLAEYVKRQAVLDASQRQASGPL